MPYIPHTDHDLAEMLKAIGVEKVEDLYNSVPEKNRLGRRLNVPEGLTELELTRLLKSMAESNLTADKAACLLGGGVYNHYVPPAIPQVLSRSEFFTAYTPYQPEVSQGTLQGIFEFQTMICELTGMEVANASIYDGASASAEAALMAARMRPKNKSGAVVIASSVNPHYRRVVKTYLANSGRDVVEVPFAADGRVDMAKLGEAANGALAVMVQSPNYFGVIEDLAAVSDVCKKTSAVHIAVVTEAVSLGLLESPGALGADLVAASGQSLGIPMGFGGPHLGLFACREDEVRKMPGRLVGETDDHDGRRGYVLTLATREQHIRRAKATSNICTSQGIMTLAASMYLSLMGPDGMEELARVNRARAEFLKDEIAKSGAGSPVFTAPTFNEFAIDIKREPAPVLAALAREGFMGGIPLGTDYPALKTAILVTATEMTSEANLSRFARALGRVCKEN